MLLLPSPGRPQCPLVDSLASGASATAFAPTVSTTAFQVSAGSLMTSPSSGTALDAGTGPCRPPTGTLGCLASAGCTMPAREVRRQVLAPVDSEDPERRRTQSQRLACGLRLLRRTRRKRLWNSQCLGVRPSLDDLQAGLSQCRPLVLRAGRNRHRATQPSNQLRRKVRPIRRRMMRAGKQRWIHSRRHAQAVIHHRPVLLEEWKQAPRQMPVPSGPPTT